MASDQLILLGGFYALALVLLAWMAERTGTWPRPAPEDFSVRSHLPV